MKTLIKTISLLVTLTILSSVNLYALEYNFNEESYIDDIPFNTHEIFHDIIADRKLAEFDFEEEGYIDDISVDSGCVTPECKYKKAVSVDFQLEEEEYVDDITFNTEFISAAALYLQAMLVDFDFEEEANVNDLSFDNENLAIHNHQNTNILKGFDLEEESVNIMDPWILNISLHKYSYKIFHKFSEFSEFSFLEPVFLK